MFIITAVWNYLNLMSTNACIRLNILNVTLGCLTLLQIMGRFTRENNYLFLDCDKIYPYL